MGSRVDGVEPQEPSAAIGTNAHGRDQRARWHVAPVAAFDAGGIQPNMGMRDFG